jgi:hypothetical protein
VLPQVEWYSVMPDHALFLSWQKAQHHFDFVAQL